MRTDFFHKKTSPTVLKEDGEFVVNPIENSPSKFLNTKKISDYFSISEKFQRVDFSNIQKF